MPNIEISEESLVPGVREKLRATLPQEVAAEVVISIQKVVCIDLENKPMPFIRIWDTEVARADQIAEILKSLADIEVVELANFVAKE